MSADAARTALAEINETIAEARRAVAEGALLELVGLDAAVTRICEAANALPMVERPGIAEQLDALAGTLDLLAGDIALQRDAAQRRRAADAYGTDSA
jgi:hypothetical protein